MRLYMSGQQNILSEKSYLGTNITILTLLVFYTVLFIFFRSDVMDPESTAWDLLFIGTASIALILLITFIKSKKLKAILQVIFVLGFFSFFYEFGSRFQFILYHNWQDEKLLTLDLSLFGSEISLLMQSIVSPYLTEAMMFSYVFYIPLLVIVAIAAYREKSAEGLGKYLFILSAGYATCYIAFILFPIASQMYYLPYQYSVKLNGGLFTYFGELIRSKAHFPGGSLPSPHCMAATLMLYSLFKYNKNLFYLFLPVTLLLYVSTVYCRYHYIWDGIIAIALAFILIKAFPLLKKFFEMITLLKNSVMHPLSVSNSLSDQ